MKRAQFVIALVVVTAVIVGVSLSVARAANPFRFKESKKADPKYADDDLSADEFDVKTKVPLVGEFTQVVGNTVIELNGAGLVVGLDGTGEDPPPSEARQMVIEDMKRHNVPNPSKILKSPNVAVVILKAYLPPLIRKGEFFDVEVTLPPGSKVKSLNGGRLMPTFLSETAYVPGRGELMGHQYAVAQGPILCAATGRRRKGMADGLRRGRIVAGAKSLKDRNLDLYLRNEFRSERMSFKIAKAIGLRFYEYDRHGQQVPLAVAKTDQRIELKVLSRYRDNYPRYLDVIRKISFRETDVAQHVRMRSLKAELLNPETSNQAALKLEAIGDQSIPVLKGGLRSKDPEVRFNASVALAYLGDPSGLNALIDSVRNEYAFRVFALAALSTLEEPEVHVKLRELMDSESAETRYGAFRALTTLDRNDPFAKGKKCNNEFMLHVLATNGPPMAHITNEKKAEVVLFGAEQVLRTPLIARAGTRIMVTASAGSDQVTATRFQVGREEERKTVSSRLEDVILALTELGATFPDVAQFLAEVDEQHNLQGRLEIDALPRAGRYYERPATEVADGSAKAKQRVGNDRMAPNLFAVDPSKKQKLAADSLREEEDRAPSSKQGRKSTGRSDDDSDTSPAASKPVDDDDSAGPSAKADSNSASAVTQASYEKRADNSKATDANAQDEAKTAPAPSRFNLFRWFNLGDRGVPGNKEP